MDTTHHATSRRALLRAGGLGVAGAAFLAACGQDSGPRSGLSGSAITTTTVTPEVPVTQPNAASLELDVTTLRTANSLELLAAEAYTTYGKKLTDADLRAAAARFATDHEAAAEVFAADVPSELSTGSPNPYLQANFVDPLAETLTNDAAITSLFNVIESMLTATYIAAAGTFTTAEWRQKVMTYGAASARRSSVFGNGGAGSVPTTALFPLADLIPNKAYLSPENEADATTTTEAGN